MRIESFRHQTQSLTKILLAVAVLLGTLLFLRIGSFVDASQAMTVTDPVAAGVADAVDLKTVLAQTRACANEIKKNNLFIPGIARQYPVSEVLGILGHEALIGGKWYQVGDTVGEARIVAIEPTKVRVSWDGQEKELSPMGATGASAGGRFERPGFPGRKAGSSGSAKAVITGSRPEPKRKSSSLSAQEREQKVNRWKSASPEEKQRFKNEVHQKLKKKNR